MRFGEVRSLKWANVKDDEIELAALDAKNDEARIIPMVGADLAGILARRKEAQKVKRRGTATIIASLIFHHNAKPIVDIRKAWKSACKKAAVPNLLFHDLRRSAVKHLDEAGVSRDVAMSISGHKSQSMYSRYNIVNTSGHGKPLNRRRRTAKGLLGETWFPSASRLDFAGRARTKNPGPFFRSCTVRAQLARFDKRGFRSEIGSP
jgi:integrase